MLDEAAAGDERYLTNPAQALRQLQTITAGDDCRCDLHADVPGANLSGKGFLFPPDYLAPQVNQHLRYVDLDWANFVTSTA